MFERELDSAVELARDAGKILLEIYATDFDVEFKSGTDPVTYGSVAIALTVVALAASWIPARRAAGVDPSNALRAE